MHDIEQRRRDFMREQRDLYDYIEARLMAKAYDSAGDAASGAETGHGAANRCWAMQAQWERRMREMRGET